MRTKRIILSVLSVAVVALASWGVDCLWAARFWPFSTGTKDGAFLGTTFGMSVPEVDELSQSASKLLSREDFRSVERDPKVGYIDAELVFSDDRQELASLYMPSIEMLNSSVQAEFEFRSGRRKPVMVDLDPFAVKPDAVVAALDAKLRDSYRFVKK